MIEAGLGSEIALPRSNFAVEEGWTKRGRVGIIYRVRHVTVP